MQFRYVKMSKFLVYFYIKFNFIIDLNINRNSTLLLLERII